MKKMKWFFLFLPFLYNNNNIFGQGFNTEVSPKEHSEYFKITLQYQSREAINNFYIDENKVKHPVHNSRDEAITYLKEKTKEAKNLNKTDSLTIPHTLYIWLPKDANQDEKRKETVFFDLEKGVINEQQIKK